MDPISPQSQTMANNLPNGHRKVGPIIAILIIVLILIIGALYLFASKINQQTNLDTDIVNETTETKLQTVTSVTNTADTVEAIQADLDSSTNGLDNQNF